MAWKNGEHDIVNWHTMSDKTAALIIVQGEGLLKETVETSKAISARADKLISIQITILTGLTVYLFGNGVKWPLTFLQLTAILALVIVSISFINAYRSYRKYNVAVPGEFPNVLATSAFIDSFQDTQHEYLNMVMNVVQSIQARIDVNTESNKKRMNWNSSSLNWLLFLPISPLLAYLFLWICSGCHS